MISLRKPIEKCPFRGLVNYFISKSFAYSKMLLVIIYRIVFYIRFTKPL